MENLTVSRTLNEDEYNELLRQTVAVIETYRFQTAKHLNTAAMSSYWEIGKLLEGKKIEGKHGDGVVKRLSVDLKSKYHLIPKNKLQELVANEMKISNND